MDATSRARPEVGVPERIFAIEGRLLLDGRLVPGAVVVRDGRIAEIRRGATDPLPAPVYSADVVSPGLIDVQVNGGFGVEIGDDPRTLAHLAQQLPRTGISAYLPTCVSSAEPFYRRAIDAFEKGRDAPGATAMGMHLEGPLLSSKRAGAHNPDIIAAARPEVYDAILESGHVRLVTLAPERPGALAAIERLRRHEVVVSLGHTEATYDEFLAGVDRGATMATHLYNAMSPFKHRAPGAAGAALTDARVAVGVIPDGIHCHPAALDVAVRCKGWERVVLVTDMIAGAGMPPGRCQFDGRPVVVDEHSARLEDGTLAGSVLRMDQAIRNMVERVGVPVADALRMASEVPARLMGWARKGRLVVGADADLTLFDRDLTVRATFIGGTCYYAGAHT